MTSSIVQLLSANATKYTTALSGSAYVLKSEKYGPWEENKVSIGRFNGVATASLYLGDSLETCKAEVDSSNKLAYRFSLDSADAKMVLDLESWGRDHPQFSGSLLQPSGSGGWEPTKEVADWAYANHFQGIRFESHIRRGYINYVLWHDRTEISRDAFERVDDGGDA